MSKSKIVPASTSRSTFGPIIALAAAIAAVVVMIPGIAGAVEAPKEEAPESTITITQNDSAIQSPCLPAAFVLTRQVRNMSEYFELIVRASAPPCDPINAKAVVYSMPGNGVAWPQTLVEVKEFTISKAGTTTIRFEKACDPVQFDVITGDAPKVISPEGEHHGPLLFPLDTETALQHWGTDCEGSTTTTTSTTSTTTPEVNPTTTVAPTTTVPVSVSPTTVVAPTTVLGISEERNPGAGVDNAGVEAKTEVKDEKLAYTGSNPLGAIYIGLTMAAAGIGLVVAARRRSADA